MSNIIKLVVETYERLSLTLQSIDIEVDPTQLWEKTTALMTDSVTKNLKIEDGVSDVFKTDSCAFSLIVQISYC